MLNPQAQKWVEKNYSKDREDKIIINKEDTHNIFGKKSNLIGPLVIEDFSKLKTICLSKLKITSLKIINCSQLTDIRLSELTKLDDLSVNYCSGLINLEVSNCSKLKFLDCSYSPLISIDLNNCPEFDKVIREREIIRNLLIVGSTGCGKSALANVLSGSDDFEESKYSISETRSFKNKIFKWEDTKYRVVDTTGIFNTGLAVEEVFSRIKEGIGSMPEGISQILFVIDGNFTAYEIKMIEICEKLILMSGIVKYLTIVRTRFSNFKNEKRCETDIEKMIEENETIARIIKSCRGIIHVDNPPINILVDDDDDDDKEDIIRINKRTREKSRNKLLTHLVKETRQGLYYKSDMWNVILNN
ncbi:hypothetical protein C1645_877011 [Glomus cerebriforme]|uniref:AIG1-type G domain-containing protein n=1 Tax=Glomus cerebriforme TaxID=658196 RepID=A0A397SS98_9GLOM|nr:hypothetical protein C1645_877011 [Glomus cerebriforme]